MNFKVIALLFCLITPLSIFGQDGKFKGTAKGSKGAINVTVTLIDGMITAVDVTRSREKEESIYPLITQAIIDNNNINIDVVGATKTSTGFLAAIEMALIDVPVEYKGEKITLDTAATPEVAETKPAAESKKPTGRKRQTTGRKRQTKKK